MTKEKKLFIVIVSVYLASQQFFNPLGAISQQLGKFLFYAFTLIALIIALNKKNVSNNYPKKAYSLIIIGILFSIFMGGTFHEQSINICIIASLPYLLSYLFLYILFKVNISNYKIEKLLKTMVICSAIIYISNLIVFPNKIFGVEKDEYDMSRGFARIGVPMIEIVVVYFFYSINQWILSKNKKSIFYIILCLLLIFMSLTRQIIIFSIIAGVWFILIKASKTKKMITLSVIIVCFIFIIPILVI